jgi:AraC-like DNA-binding protein
MDDYQHIQIPGFGCTYINEYEQASRGADFRLRFLAANEKLSIETKGPTLVFPLEAGVGTVSVGKHIARIDFRSFQIIPKRAIWTVVSETPLLKVAVIDGSDSTIDATAKEFNLGKKNLGEKLQVFRTLPRSGWINEVCHRYIFERCIAEQPESKASAFLEMELFKEAYYRSIRGLPGTKASTPFFAQLQKPLQMALQYIEEHLFDEIDLDHLAKVALASKPSLIRYFRKDLSCSPIKYLWNRRLQEAKILLATGRHSVTEVSQIIGYRDVSSFSHAYHEYFGSSPSSQQRRKEPV